MGLAVGVVALLVGFVVSWSVVAAGAVITAVFAFLWIRDVARPRRLSEAAELAVVPETRANRPRHDAPAPAARRQPAKLSRNVFLEISTLGLGGVIGGLVTLPVLGFAVAPAFLKQGIRQHDLGPISDYPVGEYVVTTYTSDPNEGFVSRRTAFVRNNGMLGNLPSFTILSNRCVHLGCPVEPNGQTEFAAKKTYKDVTMIPVNPSGFGCPCHDSQYDTEGNRTSGPAPRALDRYSFSIVNGHLLVGSPFGVAFVSGKGAQAQIHETGYAFPGEPVSGIESWLYPVQPPH